MSKDIAQMSPQFQKLVEDVSEWKKSRGELAYHVQEEVKSLLEQERQKVREEERERIFNETAELRIFYGKKENMPAYKLVHDTIRKIWLVLGAKQNEKGDWELSQPKKEQDV